MFLVISVFLTSGHTSPDLKTALASVPEGGVLKANFIQKRYLSHIPKPINSTGEIVLWNGRGLLWKTNQPFAHSTLLTKKGLFQVEDGKKISLTPGQAKSNDGALLDLISHILNGSFSEIKDLKVETLASSRAGKWKLRLLPSENVQSFISSIVVEGERYITHIIIYRPNSDKDEIVLSNHTVFDRDHINEAMSDQTREWLDG